MKKILPFLIALPLLCTQTNCAASDDSSAPARTSLGTQRDVKKCRKHRKSLSAQDPQAKSIWPSNQGYCPFYYIKSIGADGETLITADETVWQISSRSAKTALRWGANTPVAISQAHWFSKYEYFLTNTATNEKVNAKLSQGPFLQYSVFITQINQYSRTITLSNGTGWYIYDQKNLASWQVGQAVLLGINTGWFGGSNLIVNINENNCSTANKTV